MNELSKSTWKELEIKEGVIVNYLCPQREKQMVIGEVAKKVVNHGLTAVVLDLSLPANEQLLFLAGKAATEEGKTQLRRIDCLRQICGKDESARKGLLGQEYDLIGRRKNKNTKWYEKNLEEITRENSLSAEDVAFLTQTLESKIAIERFFRGVDRQLVEVIETGVDEGKKIVVVSDVGEGVGEEGSLLEKLSVRESLVSKLGWIVVSGEKQNSLGFDLGGKVWYLDYFASEKGIDKKAEMRRQFDEIANRFGIEMPELLALTRILDSEILMEIYEGMNEFRARGVCKQLMLDGSGVFVQTSSGWTVDPYIRADIANSFKESHPEDYQKCNARLAAYHSQNRS